MLNEAAKVLARLAAEAQAVSVVSQAGPTANHAPAALVSAAILDPMVKASNSTENQAINPASNQENVHNSA
jgi:hypothetical protein